MHVSEKLNKIETKLNMAGSIPIVGIISGSFRASVGVIQLVAGAVFAFIGFIGKQLNGNPILKQMAKRGPEFIIHGILNQIRGQIEIIAALTIVGSITLGAYQLWVRENQTGENGFRPFISYIKN